MADEAILGTTDPVEGHIQRAVDQGLIDLRMHVVGMGGLAIDQVSNADSSTPAAATTSRLK